MFALIGILVVLFVLCVIAHAVWDVLVVLLQVALTLVGVVVALTVFCAIVGALTH